MDPDQILTATEANLSALARKLTQAYAKALEDTKVDPLPIFVLGLAGGALGMRLFKTGMGLVVAGGLAYWAFTKLDSPKTQVMQLAEVPEIKRQKVLSQQLKLPQPIRIN